MKKKNIKIMILLAVLIIMLIPIKEDYLDGGTTEYNAVLYGITKYHTMTSSSDGEFGYDVGTVVRILRFDVYDNVEFVPVELKR